MVHLFHNVPYVKHNIFYRLFQRSDMSYSLTGPHVSWCRDNRHQYPAALVTNTDTAVLLSYNSVSDQIKSSDQTWDLIWSSECDGRAKMASMHVCVCVRVCVCQCVCVYVCARARIEFHTEFTPNMLTRNLKKERKKKTKEKRNKRSLSCL